MQEPLTYRRSLLANVLAAINAPELVYSDGVAEFGQAFFEQAVAKGHEGVMAKHRSSRYLPGKRSSAWKKIKPTQVLPCVIIGYTMGGDGFQAFSWPAPTMGHFVTLAKLPRCRTRFASLQQRIIVFRVSILTAVVLGSHWALRQYRRQLDRPRIRWR